MKKILLTITLLFSINLFADQSFSIMFPSYDKFVKFIKDSGLTEEEIEFAYQNCDSDPQNAFICAMAYDYGYGLSDPKIENWYLLAADADIHIGGKSAKYEYADYMIRHDKPGYIDKYFKAGDCYTKRSKGMCFYYLGMAKYLKNPKDCKYLMQAKRFGTKPNLVDRLCTK